MNEDRKAHIIRGLKAGVRLDGRKLDEFREISIEFGVTSTAEGSAKVRVGDCEVMAGVKMNLGIPYPDAPEDGVLMVNCELTPMSSPDFEAGPPSIDSIEISRVIDRGIRESHCFNTKSLCVTPKEVVWMVQVDIIPINFDGNLITIGGVAALAALLDARYPKLDEDNKVDYHTRTDKKLGLERYPIPITVGKIGDYLIVDPTAEEEAVLDARLTVTVLEDDTICALQKGGDVPLSIDEIRKIVDMAIEKSHYLRDKLLEVAPK